MIFKGWQQPRNGSLAPVLLTRMPLPDGLAGAQSGKGPTITGIAARASEPTKIYCMDGVGLPLFASVGARNPALFCTTRTNNVLTLNEIWYILDMAIAGVDTGTINTMSVQGLTWRSSNNNLYFCIEAGTSSRIVQFSPDLARSSGTAAGGVVSVIVFASTMNGLAGDNIRDTLIGNTGASVRRRSYTDFGITGLGTNLNLPFTEADMGYHDSSTDRWYVTYGPNGVPGKLACYQMNANMGSAIYLGSATFEEALAIEGVIVRSDEILIAQDAWYHNSTGVNEILVYKAPLTFK